LNRGRHLCSAGRPSRWALAHISSFILTCTFILTNCVLILTACLEWRNCVPYYWESTFIASFEMVQLCYSMVDKHVLNCFLSKTWPFPYVVRNSNWNGKSICWEFPGSGWNCPSVNQGLSKRSLWVMLEQLKNAIETRWEFNWDRQVKTVLFNMTFASP